MRHAMKHIGDCGVDAGMLMIGDPCYFIGDDCSAREEFPTWGVFLNKQLGFDKPDEEREEKTQMSFPMGHDGLGVAFNTTYGDGSYPVYVCEETEGRPRFAIVIMDGTPIEDIIK